MGKDERMVNTPPLERIELQVKRRERRGVMKCHPSKELDSGMLMKKNDEKRKRWCKNTPLLERIDLRENEMSEDLDRR